MKNIFATFRLRLFPAVLLVAAGLLASACKKEETKSDDEIIRDYISSNNITTAQKQPSGLYYVPVLANPTGLRAVATNTVAVLYTGRLMDGTVFDASSNRGNVPISFVLGTGRVIQGWDEGIALMRKGEKAQLLIPSALAYGSRGQGSIPANAVLRFDVELTDVR